MASGNGKPQPAELRQPAPQPRVPLGRRLQFTHTPKVRLALQQVAQALADEGLAFGKRSFHNVSFASATAAARSPAAR